MVGGGVPSDYLVSTQLQLWLFCCWGCGCCWAVTIKKKKKSNRVQMLVRKLETYSQTIMNDSQDIEKYYRTDNVSRNRKKNEAYAKQSQITSFFGKKKE